MSDKSKQSKKIIIKSTAYRLLNRSVLVALIVSITQLCGLDDIQAEELADARTRVVPQAEQKKQQIANESSIPGKLSDVLPTQFENEVRCLALNIYFEARGESEMGQRAVGHVVMNRVAHSGYPSSVCEVVHQGGERQLHRCQFSWWCDGRSDKPINKKAWIQSSRLARKIYLGILKDTTDGALWYHATYVTPYWSKILLQGDKIGQHIFYLENRLSKNTL